MSMFRGKDFLSSS